jgi:ubiquinone/menaquinone biosynthesis C-methylase UbiE
MEAGPIVSIYERVFRPAFTRLGSSLTYADEARWLDAAIHPVEGPVLDIACGTGRYTRMLADRLNSDRIVGLDLSPAMLDRACRVAMQTGYPAVTFIRASASALPFADASMGAVNCFGALHLFPEPAEAIREVGRVLRPGASFTCLTAIECSDGARGIIQSLFSRTATFRFFAEAWLHEELQRAGIEVDRLDRHGMVVLFSGRKRAAA